jgi:hypothetical protein
MESAAYCGLFFALLLCGLTDHCLVPFVLWLLHISFLQLKSPLEAGVSKYATNHTALLSERTATVIFSCAQTLTHRWDGRAAGSFRLRRARVSPCCSARSSCHWPLTEVERRLL